MRLGLMASWTGVQCALCIIAAMESFSLCFVDKGCSRSVDTLYGTAAAEARQIEMCTLHLALLHEHEHEAEAQNNIMHVIQCYCASNALEARAYIPIHNMCTRLVYCSVSRFNIFYTFIMKLRANPVIKFEANRIIAAPNKFASIVCVCINGILHFSRSWCGRNSIRSGEIDSYVVGRRQRRCSSCPPSHLLKLTDGWANERVGGIIFYYLTIKFTEPNGKFFESLFLIR